MDQQEWNKRFQQVHNTLSKYHRESGYAKDTPIAVKTNPEDIKLKKHGCIACGQPMRHFFFANHRFCAQCRGTINADADYQQAFQKISQWMSEFYTLSDVYPIVQIINAWNISVGRPVRIAGSRKRKIIKCKGFMRKDVIEVNMIYAYVQLWMREEWRGRQKRKSLQGICIKKIAYWYMAQYLYFYGKTEQAERMNLKWKLDKDVSPFFFVERDRNDLREEMEKLVTQHPLH